MILSSANRGLLTVDLRPAIEGGALDIFTFENDRLCRLDSYKRIDGFYGNVANVESTGGPKRFFFCLNSQRERYDWTNIRSYWSLNKTYCELEKENPAKLTMTAECCADAGLEEKDIYLTPLASEIVIESISCDFTGMIYSSSKLKEVKAYLINVSATCPVIYNEDFRALRIINVDMLNPTDVKNFAFPENIADEIADELGPAPLSPDIRFLCYPNRGDDLSPSTQCTRLVIEGIVDGEKYYWPITIGDGNIQRNSQYTYRITIRRKGVTDPNTPIEAQDIDIRMQIKPWTEKEDYEVSF